MSTQLIFLARVLRAPHDGPSKCCQDHRRLLRLRRLLLPAGLRHGSNVQGLLDERKGIGSCAAQAVLHAPLPHGLCVGFQAGFLHLDLQGYRASAA